MATILLSAAGSALGGAVGGSVLGIGSAAIGQALGATAGALIDQQILGSGSRAVETGRARSLRVQTAQEGAPIPRAFGRMRVSGQIIWSTRYLETVTTTSQGGKGGPRTTVREYGYTISFAVGLCEGAVNRIGRIWADGTPMDLEDVTWRLYPGDGNQLPDPKIEAVEGAENAPSFRGTAYVVFEDLDVGRYGNRIPQLAFEVFRDASPAEPLANAEEIGAPLSEIVQAVCLSPGTGEFALATETTRHVFPGGGSRFANANNALAKPDVIVALDQLEAELPNCDAVSMVIAWFGDDLRCGRCTVMPRIEERGRAYEPGGWSAAGLDTSDAPLVSTDADGRPNYGGCPADSSIIAAIRELNARGKKVVLYPFLLMDIPAGNALEDPYSGSASQPHFPWRGRITLDKAPGVAGSTDQTAAAVAEVAAFFGTSLAADFTVGSDSVSYAGPAEWGWRRFVLHLSALAAAAGGVEGICIGTEMRGLTTIRSDRTSFPAVAELKSLAGEVRQLLPATKIGYAADWSEYFGHQPADGSGDVLFHLDPLWSDPEIDFIGIDDYTPLSDWRHEGEHLDRGAASSPYALDYLGANVEGGEYYDFYYADAADRIAQIRTPITDGAHGEPWLFRPKDIRGWWSNAHHNRVGGVRDTAPTAWVPQSKPVWLTETGCPSVDLGANAPNRFLDPKSSESLLPPFSRGNRDDDVQRRFLQAKLGHWAAPGVNPVSAVYGGEMIPADRVFVWTWDSRPWPDFPARESVWADGPQHRLGHWITGRASTPSLAEVIAEICQRSGAFDLDLSGLHGSVEGYMIETVETARASLQPLLLAHDIEVGESGGRIRFTPASTASRVEIDAGEIVAEGDDGLSSMELRHTVTDGAPSSVRLSFHHAESDYRLGAVESGVAVDGGEEVAESSFAMALTGSAARRLTDRWLATALARREEAALTLPPSRLALEPGDEIVLAGNSDRRLRIERTSDGTAREIAAARALSHDIMPAHLEDRRAEPAVLRPPAPVTALILDLPIAEGVESDAFPFVVAHAEPWPGQLAVYRSDAADTVERVGTITRPAVLGTLAEPLKPGDAGLWQRGSVEVSLLGGALSSASELAVLNGANRLAVETGAGWELLQFREAVMTGPGLYRLSGFLRGQRGTEALAAATHPAGTRIVVLDGGEVRLPIPVELRGLERDYLIGSAQHAPTHGSYATVGFAANTVGLRPFSPAHLRARRRATGDIAITWIRRSRVAVEGWIAPTVPLGEDGELYRLRILSAGSLLREIETAAPEILYDTAMQAADGAAGTLDIAVSQFSWSVGHGPEALTRFHV